ncbi:MAG: hypothetical protein MUF08_04695 [Burkholderiaceae bacterium]|jgi:hypothetical protein|nr:hypothetical protein [Burkholderiaceae bacterium]MCU0964360.1 hypothetical protein [Burkholderiaceae bacterium]
MTAKAKAGALLDHELAHLREELDAMAARNQLPASLKLLRKELDALPPAGSAADAAKVGAN